MEEFNDNNLLNIDKENLIKHIEYKSQILKILMIYYL